MAQEPDGGLNGPADWNDLLAPKPIKTPQQIFGPVKPSVNQQLSPQGFKPMALARGRGTRLPPMSVDPISQAVSYRADGRLKTLKISPWS